MKTVILIIIIGIFIAWLCLSTKDNYGQDASIRASAGWISGPNYGFDPIQEYADQIEEMKRRKHAKKTCKSCV